jgi:transcription antitermination factor NusG
MRDMDEPTFNVGDTVKIVGGNFDGFGGTIITAEDAAAMPHSAGSTEAGPWVAIDLFGRTVPVQQSPERLRHA